MKLTLSAGENSGDALGGALARALAERCEDLALDGVTGPAMRATGVVSRADIEQLNVMGLFEVLADLPRLVRLRRGLRSAIRSAGVNAFVGIDAPDFNLGLARGLKADGVGTAQLVAPSVWAWRRYRIPKIARSVDLLLTLFPFEPALFADTGLDVRFVGHPMADSLPIKSDRAAARQRLGLNERATVIALLPGSRAGELARHAALIRETVARLGNDHPDARFLLLLANDDHRALLGPIDIPGVEVLTGQTRDGLAAANVALAASGTVTLEALLLKTPTVVFYRLAGSTYQVARWLRLVKSRYVSLPNVLAGRELVPERLQHAARPEQLAADINAWLNAPERCRAFVETAEAIHSTLARGAAGQAADALLERFGSRR